MKPLIQKLTETYGPSGHESQIREIIRAEIAGLTPDISVDPMGSLIAVVNRGAATGKKVMLSAHMDEIGVMVTHVDENGFARFLPLGGLRAHTLVGNRVRFADGTVGVIGEEKRSDTSKTPDIAQLFIDSGATSRQTCKLKVGDAAGMDRPFVDMGHRLAAKSMDDRIGVAVLIETLRALKETPHEVQAVFSVQEEVGLRGARTSAFGLDPDVGIAVDVTANGDTPRGLKMEVALGKGPAVKVRDDGMLADPRVVQWMVAGAEAAGLPYQMEVLEGGSTDAAAIQITRAGVPAGCLSIPCRYVHTVSEVVDIRDVENAVKLLVALLSRPIEEF